MIEQPSGQPRLEFAGKQLWIDCDGRWTLSDRRFGTTAAALLDHRNIISTLPLLDLDYQDVASAINADLGESVSTPGTHRNGHHQQVSALDRAGDLLGLMPAHCRSMRA